MDYSKWKKIFYILMILSLLINITSKVFASNSSSIDVTSLMGNDFTLPNFDNLISQNSDKDCYFIIRRNYGDIVLVFTNRVVGGLNNKLTPYLSPSGGTPATGYLLQFYSVGCNYVLNNNSWTSYSGFTNQLYNLGSFNDLLLSSVDMLNGIDDSIVFAKYQVGVELEPPVITNDTEDLELLNFEYLQIEGNDYSQNRFYLDVFDLNGFTNEQIELYQYAMGRKNRILLTTDCPYYNQDLSNSENSIYWIPKKDLGLTWKEQGKYRFEFISSTIEGEGEDELEYLEIVGEPVTFTLSSGVALSQIEQANQERLIDEQRGQTDAINKQNEQNQEFYNNILSNDYDENQIDDGLSGSTGGAENFDDSEYTGLFSAIFGKFSNIINGNYSSVETIEYPVMNTDGKIVIRSDLLSSKIQGTFIYIFLQAFWLFLFGMYIFKFSNNLIRKIKDGSILNGYDNKDEVITSTML